MSFQPPEKILLKRICVLIVFVFSYNLSHAFPLSRYQLLFMFVLFVRIVQFSFCGPSFSFSLSPSLQGPFTFSLSLFSLLGNLISATTFYLSEPTDRKITSIKRIFFHFNSSYFNLPLLSLRLCVYVSFYFDQLIYKNIFQLSFSARPVFFSVNSPTFVIILDIFLFVRKRTSRVNKTVAS